MVNVEIARLTQEGRLTVNVEQINVEIDKGSYHQVSARPVLHTNLYQMMKLDASERSVPILKSFK